MSRDFTDDLIETLVTARENGASYNECAALTRDVFLAPWSTLGPRDLPDVRDRHIVYDEDDDGDRDLPLLRDESAFHRDRDEGENEEAGL